MCKLDELKLSEDHKAVLVDGGVWVELPRKFEDIAYIKAECEACKKATFLHCVQLGAVDRKAICEMGEDAKVFENTNPPPQSGQLYEQYLEKHAPKPVEVVEEPAPEPQKRSLIDKVKENLKLW